MGEGNKAVGFFKNIFLGTEYDEDEEYFEEEILEEVEDSFEKRKSYPPSQSNSKVVSIHPNVKMEVVRTSPETISDAFPICDYVRENKVCVVNLEGIDPKESQRIADFLAGSAYAFNGDIQRISKHVFLIAPTSVEITGNLKEELKESGVIFPWLSKSPLK